MANVDAKTRLNLTIGAAKHSLPLYDSYSDFYNGKYVRIKAFNKNLYAPLTQTRSELSVNAGVIMGGTRYYFLTSAFEREEAFASPGAFYRHFGNDIRFDLQKVLTATAIVPETGTYNVIIKANWVGEFNDYHSYRRNSFYRLQSRLNGTILTDTGIHSLAESIFYPHSHGGEIVSSGNGRAWFTMGNLNLELTAGSHNFELWVEGYSNNNKHAGMYVDPFQVELTYLG